MLLLPLLAILSVVVEGRAVGKEDSTGPLCSDPGAVSGKSFTYVVVGEYGIKFHGRLKFVRNH